MSATTVYLNADYVFYVTTSQFSTGAGYDAASVPTYRIYEMETGTAVANGSMALLDDANTVGLYSEKVTLSSPTYSLGKHYCVYIAATVDGVAATTTREFVVRQSPDLDTSGHTRLQASGLDQIVITEATGRATTWPQMIPHMYAAFFNRYTRSLNTQTLLKADDSTTLMTGTVTESGTTLVRGKHA